MMTAYDDYQRAEKALSFIPADCPREVWVKVAQAIKSEFADAGFDLYDRWSQGGTSYNERDARDTYRSIKQSGGVTLSSLFYIAKQHGYSVAHSRTELGHQARQESALMAAKRAADALREQKELERRHAQAAAASVTLLSRLPDATADNPYLKKKGLPSVPGLKQTRDGKLVVPVFDAEGRVCTVQYIAEDGTKIFKRNSKRKGGFLLIGGTPTEKLLECEGVAKAITLNCATGIPTVVAFSKDNMLTVAKHMRSMYPKAHLMICADNDRFSEHNGGVEVAMKVAAEVGACIAVPKFTGATGTDFDDLRMITGLETVREQVEAAWQTFPPAPALPKAEVTSTGKQYRLLSAADLCSIQPMQWMVAGVLPMVGLAAIYGPSGSGKSFLALDLSASIAAGNSGWFGRRIKQVPVTYVALEGEQGISKRVQAWTMHHKTVAPAQMRFISQPLNLRSNTDVEALGAAVVSSGGQDGLIIVDTLNRAAEGAEENSSAHMGELIGGAKRLQSIVGGLVLLVHHTGKDRQAGLRGHSSLHAALDGAIEVSRSGINREWNVAKSKDDADGQVNAFQLEVITVGQDQHGEDITSCVVVADQAAIPVEKVKKPSGKNQKIAAEVLAAALRTGQVGIEGGPAGHPAIDYETAVSSVANRLSCPSNKRTYIARQVIGDMAANGFYDLQGAWLWAK